MAVAAGNKAASFAKKKAEHQHQTGSRPQREQSRTAGQNSLISDDPQVEQAVWFPRQASTEGWDMQQREEERKKVRTIPAQSRIIPTLLAWTNHTLLFTQ
jgi:hypothetical protein